MMKEWKKNLINSHFESAKNLINELLYLLKNKPVDYFEPTNIQGLKFSGSIVFLGVLFLFLPFNYPEIFFLLPKVAFYFSVLVVVPLVTPIFFIQLIAPFPASLLEDKFKKFVEENKYYREIAAPKTVIQEFYNEYNRDLRIGEAKRFELYLLQGKKFNHSDYIIRDSYGLLKSFFFWPIFQINNSSQHNGIFKKIIYYLFLILGIVYTKLYRTFEKPTLYIFYNFISIKKNTPSNHSSLIEDPTEQSEFDPLELNKNTLTKFLKVKFLPIFPIEEDGRKDWSDETKIWLYKAWNATSGPAKNKSDREKEVLDEFSNEFKNIAGGKVPSKSTLRRAVDEYMS